MMEILGFVFENFLLVLFGALFILGYIQYKDLKTRTTKINDLFVKTLNSYLEAKINEAKETTDDILKKYGREDTVSTEINRLLLLIEKGVSGSINDKVTTSNAINKFKLSKKIDFKRYPYLLELEKLGTFNDEGETLENDINDARKEYNVLAFQYNEKASNFPIQYLTKYLGLTSQYMIFDQPKNAKYHDIYEVFEEVETDINSLANLNMSMPDEDDLNDLILKNKKEEEPEEIKIEHNDTILKPTISLEEKEERE